MKVARTVLKGESGSNAADLLNNLNHFEIVETQADLTFKPTKVWKLFRNKSALYPIGIQSFEDLRHEGYLYVDKTAYIYQLVTTGKPYFLSRPRRFGKSLLLSTLKAYFEGKKELFEGLAIAKLETQWTVRPVLHLDLNAEKYDTLENLDKQVTSQLMAWEALYGCNAADWTYFHPFLERDQSGLCTGRAANRCTHRRDGGEERHIASGSDRTDDSHVRRLSFFVKNRSKGCTTLSACSMPCSS